MSSARYYYIILYISDVYVAYKFEWISILMEVKVIQLWTVDYLLPNLQYCSNYYTILVCIVYLSSLWTYIPFLSLSYSHSRKQ